MPNRSIQVRVDAKLKKQVEKLFAAMGIDVPTAVRMFFVHVVATGRIPFVVSDSRQKDIMLDDLEAYSESFHPEQRHGPFDSAEAMLKDLHRRSNEA